MRLSKKGYSLLEVVIGSGILIVVLTASMLAYVQCILLNDASNNLARAANDAQFILEQIKSLPYEDIAGYSAPAFNNLPEETVALARSVGAKMASVTVNLTWKERQINRNFSLSTYVSKQ